MTSIIEKKLEQALYKLLNGPRKIDRPIFIKDFSNNNQQLNDLLDLSTKVINPQKKALIERDIAYLKYGIEGEQRVYFELKNSFIPMLCLHDIRLEYEGYAAQFDFIIITNKFVYVLETKSLQGDIEITSDGSFVRVVKNKYGKVVKREGIYSPIAQNERHIRILREIFIKEKLTSALPIKSAVIIANPKTIVDKDRCPLPIKNNIWRYDQIASFLKKEWDDDSYEKDLLEKFLYADAEYLINHNCPQKYDYMKKYSLIDQDFKRINNTPPVAESNQNDRLRKQLKQYRLETSRREKIKPYWIFNNEQMESLINDRPETISELLAIKGFGENKAQKYGKDIINIIKKYKR